jgi:DNA transposition AAA+ family ATPase
LERRLIYKHFKRYKMNPETKEQIKNDLAQYVAKVGGQMAASRRLKDISNATISNIVNGKWENIADSMWISIQKQIKGVEGDKWLIDTTTARMVKIAKHYNDAKNYALVFCMVGAAGSGKTAPAKLFTEHKEVYLVKCKEYLNRKTFLAELLATMGKDSFGYTVDELMANVLGVLHRAKNPVIILDEADKLTDQVLLFFITIYNETEDKCGLVMQATDHLQRRINNGCSLNKKGYKEIFSRIGRKFIELPENTEDELLRIVKLNGVDDEEQAIKIVNESEGDIRRIKRGVFAYKRKMEAVAE